MRLLSLVTVASLLLILVSCSNDPLSSAEIYIAEYNFVGALKALEDSSSVGIDPMRYHRLSAIALINEGYVYKGIEEARQVSESSTDNAKTLVSAAALMLRESRFVRDVGAVLDSAIAWDPSLKSEILDLIWSRALEYLNNRTDAGYVLVDFAVKYEPLMINRLESFNPEFKKRYLEYRSVDTFLHQWANSALKFKLSRNRNPSSFAELMEFMQVQTSDTTREGWRINWVSDDDKVILKAEAKFKTPSQIPWGTILIAP